MRLIEPVVALMVEAAPSELTAPFARLGAIALLAGLAGLIDSGKALEILVVATGFLWLTATIWHVLTIGSEP